MGKQFSDPGSWLRWQPLEDILEVSVRVTPVELGRVDQAHDGCRSFAGTQASSSYACGRGLAATSRCDSMVVAFQLVTHGSDDDALLLGLDFVEHPRGMMSSRLRELPPAFRKLKDVLGDGR